MLDGSDAPEPVASLKRLFEQALRERATVYVFGRAYKTGGPGIHDVHVNQGSQGAFLNDGVDDHNDVWQDGAFIVDLGDAGWAAYFACSNTRNRRPTTAAIRRIPTPRLPIEIDRPIAAAAAEQGDRRVETSTSLAGIVPDLVLALGALRSSPDPSPDHPFASAFTTTDPGTLRGDPNTDRRPFVTRLSRGDDL